MDRAWCDVGISAWQKIVISNLSCKILIWRNFTAPVLLFGSKLKWRKSYNIPSLFSSVFYFWTTSKLFRHNRIIRQFQILPLMVRHLFSRMWQKATMWNTLYQPTQYQPVTTAMGLHASQDLWQNYQRKGIRYLTMDERAFITTSSKLRDAINP